MDRVEGREDRSYKGVIFMKSIEDQMNLDKTEIRQIIMKKLKLRSVLNNWK